MRTISYSALYAPFLLGLTLSGCIAHGMPAPIEGARNRPTALQFGMHVLPDEEHNPINPPERFEGYHAGLDYEIRESELHEDVAVFAICSGTVLYSGYAEGYGGLLAQRCMIDNEEVTVLYGHLAQEGLTPEGTVVEPGAQIGVLAAHRTLWSGWTRKHLHLGIHRGTEADLRGYVQDPAELDAFMDPADVLPRGARGRAVEQHNVVGPLERDEARPDELFPSGASSSDASA